MPSSSELRGTAPPAPKFPLRIAVLECQEPVGEVLTTYGNYGGLFERRLREAARDVKGIHHEKDITVTNWNVVKQPGKYPEFDDVDGVWVTGSRHDAFDRTTPWVVELMGYLRKLIDTQHRLRLVGVCFGHQVISEVLGAKVCRNPKGWELGVTPIHLTPAGQKFFEHASREEKPDGTVKFLRKPLEVGNLMELHSDHVENVPEDVDLLGYSDNTSVQGFHKDARIVTLQCHPELTDSVTKNIFDIRHQQGLMPEDLYKMAISRIDLPNDGLYFVRAFLRFFIGADS